MSKVVFVTGANKGLGLGLVQLMLKRDYTVFAGTRSVPASALEQLKLGYPENLEIVEIDVADDQSVASAKQFISSKTNKIDWLFNNAAVLGDIQETLFDPLNFAGMMDVYNTNTLGPLRVSNAFVSLVLNSVSKLIVNISSEAGSINECHRVNQFAYTMSKAALNMQSKLVHNQLAEDGGRVLTLHPGWVKTYMQGKLDEAATLTPEESARGILQVAEDYEASAESRALFLDYLGQEMAW